MPKATAVLSPRTMQDPVILEAMVNDQKKSNWDTEKVCTMSSLLRCINLYRRTLYCPTQDDFTLQRETPWAVKG